MATYIQDSFTDTNGTAIASHTPNVGGAWSGTNVTIQSNQGVVAFFTNNVISNATAAGSADYEVSIDVVMGGATPAGCSAGVGGRAVFAGGNYYALRYDAGAGLVRLEVVASASPTSLGTSALTYTQGQTHTLTLRMAGTAISAYVDSVLAIGPITDSTYTAAGNVGFTMLDSSANLALQVDNYLVQDIPAAGGASKYSGAMTLAGAQ